MDELFDRERLNGVRLDLLQDHLNRMGWVPTGVVGRGVLWRLEDGDEPYEVALPLTRSVRDFALRIQETVSVLAHVEGRGVREVLAEFLAEPPADDAALQELGHLRLVL